MIAWFLYVLLFNPLVLGDTCPEGYSETDPYADIDLPVPQKNPAGRNKNETSVQCFMKPSGHNDLERSLILRGGYMHSPPRYSCRKNGWDQPQTCHCKSGYKISQFGSVHHNHFEDRQWDLKCEEIYPPGNSVSWKTYKTGQNWWDSSFYWTGIADNAFMTGMTSHHDSHREDRRYTVEYSNSPNWQLKDCSGWKQLNNLDKTFSHHLHGNRVISALYSWHSNRNEDRIFWIKECSLVQIEDCINCCPVGWVRLRDKCFGLPKDTSLNWNDANNFCQRWIPGAHLASIHSSEEARLVQKHFTHDIWLGGTDSSKEGTWVWSDKTPWDYSFWHPDSPNNDGNQDCLQANWYGKWDDDWCRNLKSPLCKKSVDYGNSWNGECVKDSWNRLLPYLENLGQTNSLFTCQQKCLSKGYSYMGVQATTWCCCGNKSPPESSRVSQSDCSHNCPGNSKEKCGGHWRMNVYKING